MPKHKTSPSPSKKIYYGNAQAIITANKIRKLKKHLKQQPNDNQGAAVLAKLGA